MSAGKFVDSFYEADDRVVHPIRLQPETISASLGGQPNVIPSTGEGVVRSKISAKISKGRKEIGLGPRMVTIKYPNTVAGTPDGYEPGTSLKIVVLNKELWDGLSKGDAATYLSKTGTLGALIPESVR